MVTELLISIVLGSAAAGCFVWFYRTKQYRWLAAGLAFLLVMAIMLVG